MASERAIGEFWHRNPVGSRFVERAGLAYENDPRAYFAAFDSWYYTSQPHVLRALDRFAWKGKRVLEIGLGQGADSEQILRRGAIWSGLDLTQESVQRVSTRLSLRNLKHEGIVRGSATALPFTDRSFDIVFSHGVLHHIPDIGAAQREIHRVLRPDGRLIVMVYARNSLNYQLSIRLLRRAGLALLYALPFRVRGIYGDHVRNAKREGLRNYLKLRNFVHRSTDGPDNPYSRVYDRKTLEKDFSAFALVETFKRYLHAPPIPVHGLPGERFLGWHLWAEMKPHASPAAKPD